MDLRHLVVHFAENSGIAHNALNVVLPEYVTSGGENFPRRDEGFALAYSMRLRRFSAIVYFEQEADSWVLSRRKAA